MSASRIADQRRRISDPANFICVRLTLRSSEYRLALRQAVRYATRSSFWRLDFHFCSSLSRFAVTASEDSHRLSCFDEYGDNLVRVCNGQWMSNIPETTESICSVYVSAVSAELVYKLDRATESGRWLSDHANYTSAHTSPVFSSELRDHVTSS